MASPASRRPANGFTLVEVLVALVILALVAAMAWQGVAAMTAAREAGQRTSERAMRLATIVQQLEADLQAVYDGPTVPAVDFDGTTLRIARRAAGGVQVAAWSLREGVWRRWASPPVTLAAALREAWLRAAQAGVDDAAQLRLLDGASAWQVYFNRGGAWSNAQSSGDLVAAPLPAESASGSARATARVQVPAGLRVTIELPEGRLTRTIALLAVAA